ncbi:MAG: class I SAM-dependent methyltransferase [Candidatus Omnitrophica bacterium]|nr:class I SAM-dependent methyltransferase [Candidatus Omnitrophota bacterium]
MRITCRHADNKEYWTKRWTDIPADYPMENRDVYPLKYAELTVEERNGKILEAGCGAGRILRYYKDRGYDVVGIDFISEAIEKLKDIDPKLKVEVGDITNLKFADRSFRYILAFGLYHNLEDNLDRAVDETYRVLEEGGRVCASFRADNIQTWLTDYLTEIRVRRKTKTPTTKFHKRNLKRHEFVGLFERAGFRIESVYTVENMPILYKFAFFRSKDHKTFNENRARKEGYRLSPLGRRIQGFLMRHFPERFCNIFVLIAEKPR